jgi:hypothetical protein
MTGGPRLSASRGGDADTLSGAGDLLGWAGFPAWAVGLPAALFYFLNFSFSFLFYLKQLLI